LPPTQLYIGWLLRLVLDGLDRHRGIEHPLSFIPGARWYSEALLPSRSMPRSRGDKLAESFTHGKARGGDTDSATRLHRHPSHRRLLPARGVRGR
jgi:hypothetical protein